MIKIIRDGIQKHMDLLHKLENITTPLGKHWEIHRGINTGCNEAYVIDDDIRKQLIDEDPKSIDIIKLKMGKYQENRWTPEMKYVLWIPSSKYKEWPWSNAANETNAERVFEDVYPAISKHLIKYKDKLKNRSTATKGKFYWELSQREHNPKFLGPKLFFYDKPPVIAFYDESDAIIVNSHVRSIQTSDLFLLAILNSNFFAWYVQHKFEGKGGFRINKTNMESFHISGTEVQKKEISDLVQQILDDPDNPDVPSIEQEINQLVYKLYELTPAEIKLIEKETNK